MAPTYFTRNSAHVSDVLLPGESTHRTNQLEKDKGEEWRTKRKERLTWALGGVGVEAGDCAWSGEPSQTGVHRLYGVRNTRGCWLNSTRRKWLRHNKLYVCCRTLLLVLISLLCELLLLWRFLTFRNIVHHDEPHLALQPRHPESSQTTVLNNHTRGLPSRVSIEMMNNWMLMDCILIPKQSFAWLNCYRDSHSHKKSVGLSFTYSRLENKHKTIQSLEAVIKHKDKS